MIFEDRGDVVPTRSHHSSSRTDDASSCCSASRTDAQCSLYGRLILRETALLVRFKKRSLMSSSDHLREPELTGDAAGRSESSWKYYLSV